MPGEVVYRADIVDADEERAVRRIAGYSEPWRPSIFMPRSASRITLEIADVQIQSLTDISNADAWAEGCRRYAWDLKYWAADLGGVAPLADTPRDEFASVWDAINGKRAPWASNPWVWALTFKRVEMSSGFKERPILFSGPMVRALLAGTKTQTRRVVRYIPALGEPTAWCARAWAAEASLFHAVGDYRRFCPHGQAGDRLWVRETFAVPGRDHG